MTVQQIEECGSLPRSRYAGFAEVSYYLSARSILLYQFPVGIGTWAGRVTSAFALLRRDKPCAPQSLWGRAAGSHRRAGAALWRAAKAEGLPALPRFVPVVIEKWY